MSGLRVGIVGATGLVGQELLKVLEQRNFPLSSLRLFASDRSAGKRVYFRHGEIPVQEANEAADFSRLNLVFFTADTEVSKHYAPLALEAGAIVVDNSAAFRLDPQVPLVVPEVNPQDLQPDKRLIANPNCSTIQMVVVLNPIHRVNPMQRVIVATYQSVSGTGAAAMEELTSQSKLVLDGRATVPHVYPHQIAFNLLPEVDVFLDNGYTREEWKMVQESRKILHAENLPISATCVRVPVYVGHGEAIHVELSYPFSAGEARALLTEAPGIRVLDDPSVSLYPQPWSAAGSDQVFVGRIREDPSHPRGLVLWVVADNLRKGAALNAVQIAEELLRRGLL